MLHATAADFIRSQPIDLSLDTLVLRAEEAGFKLKRPYAIVVRSKMRTAQRRGDAVSTPAPGVVTERMRRIYEFCAAHLKEHGEGKGPRMPDICKGTDLPNGTVSMSLAALRRGGFVEYESGDYTTIAIRKELPEPGSPEPANDGEPAPKAAAGAAARSRAKVKAKPKAKAPAAAAHVVRARQVPLSSAPPPALATSKLEGAFIASLAQIGVGRAREILEDFAKRMDALVRGAIKGA